MVNYLLTEACCEQIEKYYDILVENGTKEEIDKLVNYFLTEAYCEQIEKYYDILVENGVKEETLDELIWSKKKRNK